MGRLVDSGVLWIGQYGMPTLGEYEHRNMYAT